MPTVKAAAEAVCAQSPDTVHVYVCEANGKLCIGVPKPLFAQSPAEWSSEAVLRVVTHNNTKGKGGSRKPSDICIGALTSASQSAIS